MKNSTQQFHYGKLTYQDVERGLGTNSHSQTYLIGSRFLKYYRVQESWSFNNKLHTYNFTVQIWPVSRKAKCDCGTFTSDISLCSHIALVLTNRWQEFMPQDKTAVPTAPALDPLDLMKSYFNRMVVADLVELRRRYETPAIRDWYCKK